MGLFSFFKKQQDDDSDASTFTSRSEADSRAVRGRGKKSANKSENTADDPLLPQKKRARRRLVGAIALVVAVVIGLPMVLDSEPKPLSDDIVIQIPSKDKVSAPAVPPPPDATAALEPPDNAAAEQKPAAVDAGAALTKSASETVLAPAPVAPAVVPPAPAVVKTPAIKSTLAAVDESQRAKAILEGKDETKADKKPSSASSDPVILQVAALATQERINEVQTKLKNAGIKTFTQKIATESGERTRIRISVANKEEAEKMRARLVKLGLNGTLIQPGH